MLGPFGISGRREFSKVYRNRPLALPAQAGIHGWNGVPVFAGKARAN